MPKPALRPAPEPYSLTRFAAQDRRPGRAWRRAIGGLFSIAGHVAVLLIALLLHKDPPKAEDSGPTVMASLVRSLEDAPAAAGPKEAQPVTAVPRKTKSFVRKARVSREDDTLDADEEPAPVLSEAQIAAAATAESGGGGEGGSGAGGGGSGGPCNMVRFLQDKLRKDSRVRSAVAASGLGAKAMMVWNGDWVRSTGEDGKGLAALREAILWEVGFAPQACRAKPVHGLVMISLNDGPGSARIVVGAGDWRWSDLLEVKQARP